MARRIIDIHNHPNWHCKDIRALMDEHGIEKTWLLSWEMPAGEIEAAPGYHEVMDPRGICAPLWQVVEGLHMYPDRFIGGWAPDPRDRHVRRRLKAAVDIHGIRVYGELKCRMRYDDPDAISTFRFCGELGLPVIFHLECPGFAIRRQHESRDAWVEWYGGDISVVDAMCRQCPGTAFIGHAPGFWREISADAEASEQGYPGGKVVPGGRLTDLMRKHANLHGDLSAGSGCNALARDLEHARAFVLEFQDRLLFGRDYYDRRQLDVLEKLALGEAVLDKVLCRNAERLLSGTAR